MSMIATHLADDIATITFTNSARRNVICKPMVDEMTQAIGVFSKSKARVLILRAERGVPVWSAGHDVSELPLPGRDPLAYSDPLTTILREVQQSSMPVIAM